MAQVGPIEVMDVAKLSLADGRHVLVPLEAVAEVQQVDLSGLSAGDLGDFSWRGLELKIISLDALCGLPEVPTESLNTIGIFKADKDQQPPFRAVAFSGTASPIRVEPSWLETVEPPEEGNFAGAAIMNEERYLIPDLTALLFGGGGAQ